MLPRLYDPTPTFPLVELLCEKIKMLTNWFAQPAGNRSSTDEGKIDNDDDGQSLEPDQGNGKLRNTMAGEGR